MRLSLVSRQTSEAACGASFVKAFGNRFRQDGVEAWIAGAKRGDRQAFSQLVRTYQKQALRIAQRYITGADRATGAESGGASEVGACSSAPSSPGGPV